MMAEERYGFQLLPDSTDELMKDMGPPYYAHWIAWKNSPLPDVAASTDEYLRQAIMEVCCVMMVGGIAQLLSLSRATANLVEVEIIMKLRKDKVPMKEWGKLMGQAWLDHIRVVPHTPEMEEGLKRVATAAIDRFEHGS